MKVDVQTVTSCGLTSFRYPSGRSKKALHAQDVVESINTLLSYQNDVCFYFIDNVCFVLLII